MSEVKVGFEQPKTKLASWQHRMLASWEAYFVDTLGLPDSLASERAKQEIAGTRAKEYCDHLEFKGMDFEGKKVLDLGCGHGTLVLEIAKRGGVAVGIEPCQDWRQIAQDRICNTLGLESPTFIDGDATNLLFEANSFDYVISLQVIEHVSNPKAMIREMRRVLKPGGMAYISCENYLAFREQHYKVFWLPLLPKVLGSVYLKAIGRNPHFLMNHITYVTYPKLVLYFLSSGFWSKSWPEKYKGLNSVLRYLLILRLHRKQLFGVGFSHLFYA